MTDERQRHVTAAKVLAQGDAMAAAIERAVPHRHLGMHPNLEELFSMAQAWRNYALVTRADLRRAGQPFDDEIEASDALTTRVAELLASDEGTIPMSNPSDGSIAVGDRFEVTPGVVRTVEATDFAGTFRFDGEKNWRNRVNPKWKRLK